MLAGSDRRSWFGLWFVISPRRFVALRARSVSGVLWSTSSMRWFTATTMMGGTAWGSCWFPPLGSEKGENASAATCGSRLSLFCTSASSLRSGFAHLPHTLIDGCRSYCVPRLKNVMRTIFLNLSSPRNVPLHFDSHPCIVDGGGFLRLPSGFRCSSFSDL